MTAWRLSTLESFHSSNAASARSTAILSTAGVASGTRVRTLCDDGCGHGRRSQLVPTPLESGREEKGERTSLTGMKCVESPAVHSPPR